MEPPGLFTSHQSGQCERVGLACCGRRLAALWDTAECVEIHVWDGSSWCYQGSSMLSGLGLNSRMDLVRKMRLHVLICGAMSGCMRNTLEANGIIVQPWISGTQEDVLAALRENRLASLLMPGCRGRGRCHRKARNEPRGKR